MFNMSTKNAKSWQTAIKIEVYSKVVERIFKQVINSEVEVGGKLLGTITANPQISTVSIKSYIDSGPKAISSPSYLLPDGYYQEVVFRLIERFDPSIQHLGSWHSHHTNNLNHLSDKDIQVYCSSVADPRYLPDLFIAFLVTNHNLMNKLPFKCYVFNAAYESYTELDEDQIRVVQDDYPLDEVLLTLETVGKKLQSIS